jgi:hypothetical protein
MNNPEKSNPEQESLENREFDLNYIFYLQESGLPITRKDVGNSIIIINPEEFASVGYLDIINSQGELITIDLEDNQSDEPLIIRPEELGEA